MDAPSYLKTLQRHEQLLDWFLGFIPLNGGGNDIHRFPPSLRSQLWMFGLSLNCPPIEALRKMLEHDFARGQFSILYKAFPKELQDKFILGENLAIGTVNSSDLNGAVHQVPGNDVARVIAISFGSTMVLGSNAILVTTHSSDEFCGTIVTGMNDRLGIKEGWFKSLLRKVKVPATRSQLRKKYRSQFVAGQIQIGMERHSALGVTDTSDIERDWMPTPLLWSPRRIGHPLEPGSALRLFAEQFLLLHECGHVALDHRIDHSSTSHDRMKLEFEADEWALRTSMGISSSKESAISALLGAWLFMWSANWLERLNRLYEQEYECHHPPAIERQSKLREVFFSSLKPDYKEDAHMLMEEFESHANRLWNESEWLRDPVLLAKNSLVRLLERCVKEEKPQMFMDQLPRWLLFGAPTKLTHSLAAARVALEKKMIQTPDDSQSKLQLDVLMAVYHTAQKASNSSLFQQLEEDYVKARSSWRTADGN